MAPNRPEFVGDPGESPFRFPPSPKLPGKLAGCMTTLMVLLVTVVVLYFMFLEYVRPNEFGIKEVQIGANRGIQETVYKPGLVLVVPYMQIIHRLPQNVQVLEMTQMIPGQNTAARRDLRAVAHTDPAKIQTSDGFYVDVDVSILYRITDPYKVVTQLGPDTQYLNQGILPKAEPILKEALGQLTTEEFYNSPLRVQKAELARKLLDEELEQYGMAVDHVLIRYFRYSDRIQENIEAKKLQDQLVFTNEAQRKAAEQEQQLNRVRKQGEMQVEITLEEGHAYEVKKEAEKELYVRSKEAEADLLVELAEAKRVEMRNRAMQELGADRKVAMTMAEVLKGLDSIVIPVGGQQMPNPLDLEKFLENFGVRDYDSPPSEGVKIPDILLEHRKVERTPASPDPEPAPDPAPAEDDPSPPPDSDTAPAESADNGSPAESTPVPADTSTATDTDTGADTEEAAQ